MAIRVNYFANINTCYSEGPFVMVSAGNWRIEVGNKDKYCPIQPDISINAFLEDKGLPTKFSDEDLCACIVDYLNAKVKDGTLTIRNGLPIWEIYQYLPKKNVLTSSIA